MFELLPVLRQRFLDDNGAPLAGGFLYSYIAGTSTPQGTYQDVAGITPNSNPIVLDSDGYCSVYVDLLNSAYKFVLEDANNVVKWTVDNVTESASSVPSGWTKHAVTNGQSAANLAGETLDMSVYSSVVYDFEIIRGTTVISRGQISVQNLNGTGRLIIGGTLDSEAHGVTFSISQAALIVQLKAALDSGAGDGTIKLKGNFVPK